MKHVDRRLIATLAAPAVLLALFAAGGGAGLWATLDEAERATLAAVLQTRGMLLVLVALALWANILVLGEPIFSITVLSVSPPRVRVLIFSRKAKRPITLVPQ
ncbi:MAG: hypothetical protein J0L57_18635 [Burkholderiales bacterium]|nr:hypothetical protein [Burkholderiales bacterium]